MDMSVKVGAVDGDRSPAPTQARATARGANSSDLHAWLEKAAALGQRKRITAECDPDLQPATIPHLVGGGRSPAPRCENLTSTPGHRPRSHRPDCNTPR